ncbi:hypothetical protein LXL04_002873 [Taraxacum kok-saghyz]
MSFSNYLMTTNSGHSLQRFQLNFNIRNLSSTSYYGFFGVNKQYLETIHLQVSLLHIQFQIELKTAPGDYRFPTTNQSRHCFTRYIEFHRCVAAKGDGAGECEKFAKYYRSLCPAEWVDRWNEQRENGVFPGPL